MASMRSLSCATLAVVAACSSGSNKSTTWVDGGHRDSAPDALPPYWEPTTGNVKYWDIQLAAPFDLTKGREMYVLPLWALVPAATTIDYGDGAPVAVPKGALADGIANLHVLRPMPKIICQFGTGSIDLAEPDAKKFPGFEASPPDDPTPPKTGSVIGWSTTLPANRRWLDVRTAGAALVKPLLAKRMELAKTIGCDGVLPDNNDMFRLVMNNGSGAPGSGTGFVVPAPITITEEQNWYETMAGVAHAAVLSVGARGDFESFAGFTAPLFDFEIADRCGELGNCDFTREFANTHKAVLGLEYVLDSDGNAQNVGTTCGGEGTGNTTVNGIVKDVALTGASYYACADFMPQ